MINYILGNVVRLSAHFTNFLGADTDPTTVTVEVRNPSGVTTTYTSSVVHDSTGRFHQDVSANEEGLWSYRITGAGALTAVGIGNFTVSNDFDLGTCP